MSEAAPFLLFGKSNDQCAFIMSHILIKISDKMMPALRLVVIVSSRKVQDKPNGSVRKKF